MKHILRALALTLAMLPALAAAQAPQFPQNLPANTVVGRLGIGPGPSQAIPISQLGLNATIGNAFTQFTGPTAPTKTFTLPNVTGTIALLNQAQTWTAAQTFLTANFITNANLAQMPAKTIKGNAAGSAANAQDLTATSWFDAAYCNTIGFLIVRTTGAWTCSQAITANPVWFGADPTGAANSDSAFNSALAASSFVQFPCGRFKFSGQISFSMTGSRQGLQIIGSGPCTILDWPTGGGLKITLWDGTTSAVVRDMIVATEATNVGSGILLTQSQNNLNPAAAARNQISHIQFLDAAGGGGWFTNYIEVNGPSNVQIADIGVLGIGANGTCVFLHGQSLNMVTAVVNIKDMACNSTGTGVQYGSNVNGVTVNASNFVGQTNGINVAGGLTGVKQLVVTLSQFECVNGFNIQTPLATQIVGNLILVGGLGVNSFGVAINDNQFEIVGNTFLMAAPNAGGVGLFVSSAAPSSVGIISSNVFQNMSGIGLQIQSSVSLLDVSHNVFTGNTTNITNASTSSTLRIESNVGYNPVGPSAITVGASPFTYTAGASPETVYLTTNGTVSSIAVNGFTVATLATGSATSLDLGPHETVTVTYSSASNTVFMQKMVH